MRSALFLLAGLLLLTTAGYHLMGQGTVGSWLDGREGDTLAALWLAPALAWAAVGAYWFYHAFSEKSPSWGAVLVTVASPLSVAIPLALLVDPYHPGVYMLIASAALALWAKKRLP